MTRFARILTLIALSAGSVSGIASAQEFRRADRHPAPKHRSHHGKPFVMRLAHGPSATPEVVREIQSELKADSQRARVDLKVQHQKAIQRWLAEDGVPASWSPPPRLLDLMLVGEVYVEPVQVQDLTVYRASANMDFSPDCKRVLVETFRRQEGGRRLAIFGGGLAIVLACLAGVSGYIRADEATKGYYTNPLRLLAAAGVGATSVVVYQILT